MSLTVHARRLGEEDWAKWLVPAPPRNALAGFESWRWDVWGSEPVRRLGLRILPSLAEQDVSASGADLLALEAEVALLRPQVPAVVEALLAAGVHIVARQAWIFGEDVRNVVVGEGLSDVAFEPVETIRFRLDNIAEAVRLARAISDGQGEVIIG